jgi:hypothetical protein
MSLASITARILLFEGRFSFSFFSFFFFFLSCFFMGNFKTEWRMSSVGENELFVGVCKFVCVCVFSFHYYLTSSKHSWRGVSLVSLGSLPPKKCTKGRPQGLASQDRCERETERY